MISFLETGGLELLAIGSPFSFIVLRTSFMNTLSIRRPPRRGQIHPGAFIDQGFVRT